MHNNILNSFIGSDLEKSANRSHLVKKQIWVTKNGKTFQQTVYVNPEDKEDLNAEVGEELAPTIKGMDITKYSDKSFLITGDTYTNVDTFREIKKDLGVGTYNRGKKGWFFPLSVLDKVLGTIWGKLVDKGEEDKAQAVQNQKNESLNVGDNIEVGGISASVEVGVSDSKGIKYDVDLGNGVNLKGVDEKVIEKGAETDDNKISEIVSNVTAESRNKVEKQLFGIKPVENIHNYTLEEYMGMHGLEQEDINKAIKSLRGSQEKKDSNSTQNTSSTPKKESNPKELTKQQLISKLIYNHYQAVNKAINNGDKVKDEVLRMYPDLQIAYGEKRKAMSEETKRKISEALKKRVEIDVENEKSENTLVEDLEIDLSAMILKKETLEKEMHEIYQQSRSEEDYTTKMDLNDKARDLRIRSENLIVPIRETKNAIQALNNGGELAKVSDKVGDTYEDVPDFRKVSSRDIHYNIESILTDQPPPFVPGINEEKFKARGYIFDVIRVDNDSYMMATNTHIEDSSKANPYSLMVNKEKENAPHNPKESGYVMLTLDQLVLTQDYYTTKQKATYQKEADDRTQRATDHWNKKEDSAKEGYYNQRYFYQSMPTKIKKKVSEEEWNKLSLKEREEIYIPVKKYGTKRLKTSLNDGYMYTSFHTMYERFVNPEAKKYKVINKGKPNKEIVYLNRTERAIGNYANPEVSIRWGEFEEMLKWKLNDIKTQREELSDIRKKALETSFGDSNTNDTLLESDGVLVKRQNGESIKPMQIEELQTAWSDVQKSFGKLTDNARADNLKLSHSGSKKIYASKAVGVYVPSKKTIGVSAKYGSEQLGFVLGHETAHWIDHTLGEKKGKRYISDDFESTAGKIAMEFRRNLNEKTDSKYTNSTHECFARALEQYHAMETVGEDAHYIDKGKYVAAADYVSRNTYEKSIKPLILQFFNENRGLLKSIMGKMKNNPFIKSMETYNNSKGEYKRFFAAVSIVFKEGKILLGKCAIKDDRLDKWCFPGGGREKDETIYQTATRELEEEAGIKSTPINISPIIDTNVKGIAFIPSIYKSGQIKMNEEFSDMDWFPLNQLPKDIYRSNKLILGKFSEVLRKYIDIDKKIVRVKENTIIKGF